MNNIVELGAEAVIGIEKHFATISLLMGERDDFRLPTTTALEAVVQTRLREIDSLLVRVPFTLAHAKAALHRVNQKSPPNGEKNQQYKDSAIWEAVLDLGDQYAVHFVTGDMGFFQDRNPSRGLALNLRADCVAHGITVEAYDKLTACMEALGERVPPLDRDSLTQAIDRALAPQLHTYATSYAFEIGELQDANVIPFVTERQDILAVSYELAYRASSGATPEPDLEEADSLLVIGECAFNLVAGEATNPRLSKIDYRTAGGEFVGPRSTQYIYASDGGGRTRIPLTFRLPLPGAAQD